MLAKRTKHRNKGGGGLRLSYKDLIKDIILPTMTELTSIFEKVNANSTLSGIIRSTPEDFQVDEIQQFTPSGKGEHVWLHIQKIGENTDWVASLLARIADVPRKDVSYAGMKDRHAVTTQWFSVQMPGRDAPDWKSQLPDSIILLDQRRHDRKLKRGALKGNAFKLIIRDFKGDNAELEESVQRIIQQGIPNYFGEQRFGRDGENIRKTEQWFKGDLKVKSRPKRSIYLSAARSWVFNHILSERVKNGSWNKAVQGDVFMLGTSKSFFNEAVNDEIMQRVEAQEIHPTASLWGRGRLASSDQIEKLENDVASQFKTLCKGLEQHGLKQERKSLRLSVKDLDYTFIDDGGVCLEFSLPAGAYATSVLSEIGDFKKS
jgi:tRNA pseudouridine13 synthase